MQASIEKKLLDICLQVGKGMEYLASKRVIHRDLAARNCMYVCYCTCDRKNNHCSLFRIDLHFVIKVADFGLAETIDTTKEYFRENDKCVVKLPIKWLAPESIKDKVFSEKSDVV